jgi:hypothetical protein
MTMLLIYYEFALIWNKFDEDNLLKNSSRIYFWGDAWNMTYVGGGFLNKYLHNNITNNLFRP